MDCEKFYGRSVVFDVDTGIDVDYIELDFPDTDDVREIEDFSRPILTRRAIQLAVNSESVKDVVSVLGAISDKGRLGDSDNPINLVMSHVMEMIDGSTSGVPVVPTVDLPSLPIVNSDLIEVDDNDG